MTPLPDRPKGDQHIYPTNDLREHDLTPNCWCKPTVECPDDYSHIIIHNSMDERETYEEGRKLQ